MKIITVDMDWDDDGCEMDVRGEFPMTCPVCGKSVVNELHVCGNRAPLPNAPRKRANKPVAGR